MPRRWKRGERVLVDRPAGFVPGVVTVDGAQQVTVLCDGEDEAKTWSARRIMPDPEGGTR